MSKRANQELLVLGTIRCSVIIRCFNEASHIGRLLDGLKQQTNQAFETIVVDSGSTDDTLSIVSRYPATVLKIAPQEFSFGRSLNLGCKQAKGEFIVMASAHVYPVYADWLDHLLAPFQNPQIALTYGRQTGDEHSKFSERQVFKQWYPPGSKQEQDHPFCNNANAAIRRSLWEQLPYDETLTGLEDLDWARRALQLGHKIAYCADAQIVHVHSETPMRIYNRYRREAIAFKRIFPNEKFNLWNFLGLFTSNVFHDYVSAKRESVLTKNLLDIPSFRLMQFWGTFRGFKQQGPISNKLRRTFYYPGHTSHAIEPVGSELPNRKRIVYGEEKAG